MYTHKSFCVQRRTLSKQTTYNYDILPTIYCVSTPSVHGQLVYTKRQKRNQRNNKQRDSYPNTLRKDCSK